MKSNQFTEDILDIIEITSVAKLKKLENCSDITIKRITYHIDDQYLTDRAEAYLKQYSCNSAFNYACQRLTQQCKQKQCNECVINKYCNYYISNLRSIKSKSKLNMIDLFCGAGGLSLGFTQEGFITCLANDIEHCCIETYSHNHPETPRKNIIEGDINILIRELKQLLKNQKIDIVVGGPPCQGFSMANRQRLIDDPRNKLYKSFVEVIKIVKPKFFVMENVKGMLSVVEQVKEDFTAAGYSVEAKILNARDFGVPQNRERLIYIGNRLGINNDLIFRDIQEETKTINKPVLKDALFGLKPLQASITKNATEIKNDGSGAKISPSTMKSNTYITYINQGKVFPVVFNHKARYNNPRDVEIFRRLNQGDKSDDPKIADIMPYVNRKEIFKDKYYKLENNKICKTITAHMKFDCNMYIHPTQARGLTPREAARVQSYPDDYYFKGPYTKTYMQIGNSVPPLLGRTIAKIIKKYLKKQGE